MAVDEVLLAAAARRAAPVLRLYEWQGAWLSIGYAQRFDAPAAARCRDADVQVLRRVTGGRAVLHGADLTYGVAAAATALPAGLDSSYRLLSDAILAALRELGVDADRAARAAAVAPDAGVRLLRAARHRRDLCRRSQARRQRPAARWRRSAAARLDPAARRSARRGGRCRPRSRRDEPRGTGRAAGRRARAGLIRGAARRARPSAGRPLRDLHTRCGRAARSPKRRRANWSAIPSAAAWRARSRLKSTVPKPDRHARGRCLERPPARSPRARTLRGLLATINKRKLLESAQKNLQKGAVDKALKDYEALLGADPRDANVRLKVGDLKLRLGKIRRRDRRVPEGRRSVHARRLRRQGRRDLQAGLEARSEALRRLHPAGGSLPAARPQLRGDGGAADRGGGVPARRPQARGARSAAPHGRPRRDQHGESPEGRRVAAARGPQRRKPSSNSAKRRPNSTGRAIRESRATVLQRIVELAPDRIEPCEALVMVWFEHDQARRAEPFARKLVEIDPERAESLEVLAQILETTGDHPGAIDFFRKAADRVDRTGHGRPRARDPAAPHPERTVRLRWHHRSARNRSRSPAAPVPTRRSARWGSASKRCRSTTSSRSSTTRSVSKSRSLRRRRPSRSRGRCRSAPSPSRTPAPVAKAATAPAPATAPPQPKPTPIAPAPAAPVAETVVREVPTPAAVAPAPVAAARRGAGIGCGSRAAGRRSGRLSALRQARPRRGESRGSARGATRPRGRARAAGRGARRWRGRPARGRSLDAGRPRRARRGRCDPCGSRCARGSRQSTRPRPPRCRRPLRRRPRMRLPPWLSDPPAPVEIDAGDDASPDAASADGADADIDTSATPATNCRSTPTQARSTIDIDAIAFGDDDAVETDVAARRANPSRSNRRRPPRSPNEASVAARGRRRQPMPGDRRRDGDRDRRHRVRAAAGRGGADVPDADAPSVEPTLDASEPPEENDPAGRRGSARRLRVRRDPRRKRRGRRRSGATGRREHGIRQAAEPERDLAAELAVEAERGRRRPSPKRRRRSRPRRPLRSNPRLRPRSSPKRARRSKRQRRTPCPKTPRESARRSRSPPRRPVDSPARRRP